MQAKQNLCLLGVCAKLGVQAYCSSKPQVCVPFVAIGHDNAASVTAVFFCFSG